MISRRSFLQGTCAALASAATSAAQPAGQRKKLAIITTEWRYRSHAWHMGERFLAGYPIGGRWHRPPLDIVAAYVDQHPENDLSPDRAKEFGFTVYPSIAEALRCGGKTIAVDAVLIIGEHGDYPKNDIGQKMYPRYEFFRQVVDVFRVDGRTAPVFNDKHLSWKWAWAREMVATARSMGFAFLAGSSLPVTWRMPSLDMPTGAGVEELVCVAFGGVDSYDFHALEVLQCMAERRAGGETGVVWLEAVQGPAVWDRLASGAWDKGGWERKLFDACLCRSHTLAQAPSASHRFPTLDQMKQWVKAPVAYRYQHADGLRATMLLLNGLVADFTFAARLRGESEPLSTLFHLPPNPNVVYSAALMSKAEETFLTGKAPYPVERTLLTSGLVAAGMQSLAAGQPVKTPNLSVVYQPPREAQFWRA